MIQYGTSYKEDVGNGTAKRICQSIATEYATYTPGQQHGGRKMVLNVGIVSDTDVYTESRDASGKWVVAVDTADVVCWFFKKGWRIKAQFLSALTDYYAHHLSQMAYDYVRCQAGWAGVSLPQKTLADIHQAFKGRGEVVIVEHWLFAFMRRMPNLNGQRVHPFNEREDNAAIHAWVSSHYAVSEEQRRGLIFQGLKQHDGKRCLS